MNVDTARQAAELLAPHLTGENGPAVAALLLDAGRHLIEVALPGADGPALPVRDILSAALRSGAEEVIVGLGRPTGDPMPTDDERASARRLADAATAVGVRLTDFFIFAGGDCRSFRELGLL
jgi:DNA repair protein RadC